MPQAGSKAKTLDFASTASERRSGCGKPIAWLKSRVPISASFSRQLSARMSLLFQESGKEKSGKGKPELAGPKSSWHFGIGGLKPLNTGKGTDASQPSPFPP